MQLYGEYALHLRGQACHFGRRERPQRDGAQEAHFEAGGAGVLDGFEAYARHRAESYDEILGIVGVVFGESHLVGRDFGIGALEAEVVLLHLGRVELERRHYIAVLAVAAAGGCPRALEAYLLLGAAFAGLGEDNFLHHLAHDAVGEYHGRRAVFEGEVEAQAHEVGHLLHRGRGQHYEMVVAVAAAFGGLEIVGLRRLYRAEARAAAHHVDNQRRQLRGCQVAYAFLLEAHARRRRRRHHGAARGSAPVYHINSGHFAFGLQHGHARGLPRHKLGKRLEHLALRSYRVAEIPVDTVAHRRMGDGFVALHKFHFFHSR